VCATTRGCIFKALKRAEYHAGLVHGNVYSATVVKIKYDGWEIFDLIILRSLGEGNLYIEGDVICQYF
jgi:hypothetical protein